MKNQPIEDLVAIIGRPNVGKSTLFNRLTGRRQAIESAEAGTTRDWLLGKSEWRGRQFQVADMAGMYANEEQNAGLQVDKVIKDLMTRAAVILFVVDAKAGLLASDRKIAALVRSINKPTLLAINKTSRDESDIEAEAEFAKLGFDKYFLISAINGRNTDGILDAIIAELPKKAPDLEVEEAPPVVDGEARVAILGRPNVGKSTLFNSLIGESRTLVSDIPGTTRDSIDSLVEIEGRAIRFIDTAGIRRSKQRNSHLIEKLAHLRTEKVVENSDIVILVLDGTEGITRQDMHIFELVDEYATGLLVVLNKRDLLHAGDIERLTKIFKEKAPFIAWAPILAVSAETKQGIHRIPELIGKISDNRRRSFSNTELESILGKILKLRYIPTPPNIKKITLSDLVQIRPKTPKFAVYSNLPEKIHFSYKRFFRNELYKALKLYGTAIDIRFRKLSKDDL